ncbi:hypothetical protein [Paraclostridium dentum]|uniref:hypothetical protein n=1 Tax=Paraclostridium dentum TaxID=2662455 RepID=UPI003F40E9A1
MKLNRDILKANTGVAELVRTLTIRQDNTNKAEADYKNLCELRKSSNVEVNLDTVDNPIAALAKLGYKAGSLVGLITVLVSMADVLKDMELNKQFLVEGTEEVDMFKLEKVFNCLDGSEGQVGYKRVFNKKKMRKLVDKLGRNQTLVFALKSDIQDFVDQLKRISALTQEELVLIGQDLEIIGRVMQELEIDSAKKPQVKEGMLEITQFMSVDATNQSGRNISYEHNFNLIVDKKRGRLSEKNATAVKFELKLAEYETTMFNFDAKLQDKLNEFYKNNNVDTMTEQELAQELRIIKETILEEAVVIDPAGQLAKVMSEKASEIMTQYVEAYENSNNDLFRGFPIAQERNEETNMFKSETVQQATNMIQKIAITMYEMINKTFAYKNYTSLKSIEDLAALCRRAIYTAGTRRGFSAEETFDMAINAGWLNISKRDRDGSEVLAEGSFPRFRFKAVEAIFSTELKHRFASDIMANELELEFLDEASVDIEDTFIEFVDGQATVIDEDGEEQYIICLNDSEFTGLALIDYNEEDNTVRFFEYVDQYEFEELDYILFDQLADCSLSTNAFMADDLKAMTIAATPLTALNTINMSEKEKEKAMTTHGKVVEDALNNWNDFSILPVKNREAGFSYKAKAGYIYVSRQEDGRSRMLGRKLTQCSTIKSSEAINAYAVSTVNAGFIIFK